MYYLYAYLRLYFTIHFLLYCAYKECEEGTLKIEDSDDPGRVLLLLLLNVVVVLVVARRGTALLNCL
jgi:hypothetical protein